MPSEMKETKENDINLVDGQEKSHPRLERPNLDLIQRKWRMKIADLDAHINVKPVEKQSLIKDAGTKFKNIGCHYGQEVAGQIETGSEEPADVIANVEEEIRTEHLQAQEEIELIDMLDLAFQKFGQEEVFIADQTTDEKGNVISPGFETRRLGNVEGFGETIFVIPQGRGKEMKEILQNLPALVKEKLDDRTSNTAVDLQFVDEKYGFTVRMGQEKILFLYGEVEKDDK